MKFREFLRLLLQLRLSFQLSVVREELREENRLDEGAEFRCDLSGSLGAKNNNGEETAGAFLFLGIQREHFYTEADALSCNVSDSIRVICNANAEVSVIFCGIGH